MHDEGLLGAVMWVVGYLDCWVTAQMNECGMVLGEHVRYLNSLAMINLS
jgi:hypothetical protein